MRGKEEGTAGARLRGAARGSAHGGGGAARGGAMGGGVACSLFMRA
jgi:hypothetical protein